MTKRELLAVAVRLLAIMVALYIVRSVPTTVLALEAAHPEQSVGPWVIAGTYVFMITLVFICWRFPFALAAILLPKPDGSVEVVPWSQHSVIETATVIMGLLYLYYAVSDLVYWVAYGVALNGQDIAPLAADQWASIVTTVFEVALAVVLILGARPIANVTQALRYAGKQSSN